MTPPLNPAPKWQVAAPMLFWHGCVGTDAAAIIRHGVDPTKGRVDTDFGRGFYLTTLRRQAEHWAWLKYYDLSPIEQAHSGGPVVLKFAVLPSDLAPLESLVFVRGDYHYDDYWSLVQHCRRSVPGAVQNHKNTTLDAPTRSNWFDLVFGPVAAFWQQRVAMVDSDQIGIHTLNAAALLTKIIKMGRPSHFEVITVVP